jgi:hypothetical protein
MTRGGLMDMGQNSGASTRGDFFSAHLVEGELIMEPHCACGEVLEEEYYCEKCKRQCRCLEIRCENEVTLRYVEGSIRSHPGFKNFRAVLARKDHEKPG